MTSPEPTGWCEGELAQRLGDFPGVQGVEPLDHGAALAAVEVDGVAELAHAGVDGDEAEEDAQRQQHDAEVHPAAGVVGVPDGVGVGRAALRRRRRRRLRRRLVRRRRRTSVGRRRAPPYGLRLVAWSSYAPTVRMRRQQRRCRGRGRAGRAGRRASRRSCVAEVAAAGSTWRRRRCRRRRPGRRRRRSAGVAVAARWSRVRPGAAGGAGVVRRGLAAPDDGRPAPRRHPAPAAPTTRDAARCRAECRAMRGDARAATPSCTRKLAWLTMTCAGSLGTLTMLSAGCVVESRRAVPRGCAGCSGVHTHLTE